MTKPRPEIEGLWVKELRLIPDDRGWLLEILRRDDPGFVDFGQVYMTTAYPGVIKAWHMHRRQWDMITCVRGMIRLALYDAREDSPTRGRLEEFHMGELRPLLVRVPPGVYQGFLNVGTGVALIINIPSEPYNYEDPDEVRLPPDDPSIPYSWERRMG